MRPYALDGALLLFDRETGWNALIDGPETAHLRRAAPRVLQFALSHRCNLACSFCSRDADAKALWTGSSAFDFLSEMARAGTMEVAFGGGEPLVFKGFADLVRRLHDETPLGVSFTTNGTLLSAPLLRSLEGKIGQVRLSIYEESDWRAQVRLLRDTGARFGINYLVTPARVERLQDVLLELVELGASDLLLLSYNGADPALHLSDAQLAIVDRDLAAIWRALSTRAELKLDVCWGGRLPSLPRAMSPEEGCGAGRDHLVIHSDKTLSPCSFHHLTYPFETAEDVLRLWEMQRTPMRAATAAPGCAREPDYGLTRARRRLPILEAR